MQFKGIRNNRPQPMTSGQHYPLFHSRLSQQRSEKTPASSRRVKTTRRDTKTTTTKKALYNAGKVSEIVLPIDLAQPAGLLEPLLSQLAGNHDSRWLTVISSREEATRMTRWMRESSINPDRVICLSADNEQDALDLSSRALASGTSHTVVSWFLPLKDNGVSILEEAAREGDSQGLAIRNR